MIDLLGWLGAILLLLGYFLTSRSYLEINSLKYQLLNLIGALSLVIYSCYYEAYPFILINAFWSIISIFQLVKIFKMRKLD